MRSTSTTSATATRPGGRTSPSRAASLRARRRTRCPASASRSTSSRSAPPYSSAITISGAPSTQVPWPSKHAALHLRADENGTVAVTGQPGASGYRSPSARWVALGSGSEAATAASTASRWAAETAAVSPTGRTSATSIVPSVMVPVLSRHSTSTRASTSMAASSWTSVRRRARRTTPAAKATLVSSTRPSGTMATMPPTAETSASRQSGWVWCWLMTSPMAVGIISHVTHVMMRSTDVRRAEDTSVNRRASSASLVA